MSHYDSIVVGAGNGGLTGALTLAKAGKKVLLLEKHNIPGGCGTSFRRGRFEFEAALHQLYGVGNDINGEKGSLHRVFEELGVWKYVEFVPQKEAFNLQLKGMGSITLPNTREGFVKTLQAVSPQEAESIEAYQTLVDQVAWEFERLYDTVADDVPITKENFPYTFEYGSITAGEMLDKYIKHPLVKGVYTALYGYLGLPVDRAPFAVLAALYVRDGGTWHVNGNSMAMSNAIAEEFLKTGGTLKLNTPVKKILVEDGAVRGVLTEGGETFTADTVLCNANRINVYVDLIEEKYIPEEIFSDLRVSVPGQSIFGVFLGLDCTAEQAGIDHGTMFLLPSPATPPMRYEVNQRQIE